MTIGATIRAARESRSMSGRELAEALDVTENTLYRWERDEVEPGRERLEQIASALGMRLRHAVEFLPLADEAMRDHYRRMFGEVGGVGVQLLARALYRVRYPGAGEDRRAIGDLTRELRAQYGETVESDDAVRVIEEG